MVRGILFDLDGTLFDRDAAVRGLVIDQHLRFSEALSHIPRDTYLARVLDLDAHGFGDKTAAYQQVVADFALPGSLAAALTADFWDRYHSFCRGFPDWPAPDRPHRRIDQLAELLSLVGARP